MKRTAIKRRPLADTVLAKLEPEDREYREAYGVDRLYFVVSPSGRKRWEVRYKKPDTGRWAWLGIGAYPDTSVKLARSRAQEVAETVSHGEDPLEKRRQEKAEKSSDRMAPWSVTAEEWLEHKLKEGVNDEYERHVRGWLDNDALPILGRIPISRVTRADCVRVQQRIEKRNALERARKMRVWLRAIFRYAIAHDRCDHNPAADMGVVARRKTPSKPFAHLLESDLPGFLQALRQVSSGTIVSTAVWVVVHTASRPAMVRWMHWDEIDLDNAIWTIPAERMKSSRDHLVPLTRQVIELLEGVRPLANRRGYVFPSRNGSKTPVLSSSAINNCIDLAGYKGRMTGHGSRHTAKTLLSEHGWPRDWTEMQLAHALPGLEGVYNKAAWIKPRSIMMQWYSDYLDALEAGITQEMIDEFDARIIVPGMGGERLEMTPGR
ncbi:tyrosine-type recombinase/integrase [Halomonas sp. NO4]|uniref:tyrosine-type recombinase/integrase n=1 Tax=Halomonas sp. NO4 TaxID=2484813 RepID=UPI0013D5DBD3|nr:tyrosine-type recombinase/integrase [Halomonas sp. NO4]